MNAQDIAKNYFDWVKTNYNFSELDENGTIDIQTPYLDNFGDNISFVIKKVNDSFYVTDEGFTTWNLASNGINIEKKKSYRNNMLKTIVNIEGAVLTNDNSIIKKIDIKNPAQSIHDLTQILIKVNDLTFIKGSNVKSIFLEDVTEYFNNNPKEYRKIPGFSITGKSQLNHRIDFGFITENETKLVKVHNSLNRSTVDSALATLFDTYDYRKYNYHETEQLNILVKDLDITKDKTINNLESLQEYNIDVINFSNKKDVRKKLAFG